MPWVKLFSKLTLRVGYQKLLLVVMLINILAILLVGCVLIRPLNGFGGRFFLLIAVAVLVLAPALTWWYSIYWPAFLALIPKDKVGEYCGVFTFVRVIALIWHSGPIYAACVMALSSANDGHRLGVLSALVSQSTARRLRYSLEARMMDDTHKVTAAGIQCPFGSTHEARHC